jgi:hypothetical protein
MGHTQFEKQKIIWILSSIFVQAPPADFCKNTSNEKIQTQHYSLKYKKTNNANLSVMVCCSHIFHWKSKIKFE